MQRDKKIDKHKYGDATDKQSTSFYKRFASSIIPPLTFLSPDTTSPNSESSQSNNDNIDEKVLSDDEDIAHPIGGPGPLNTFVNMLYAGMGKLNDMRGQVGDSSLDYTFSDSTENKPAPQTRPPIDYDIEESENESDDENNDLPSKSTEDDSTDLNSKNTIDLSKHFNLDTKIRKESVQELLYKDSDESTTAIASDPSKGTPFQKSVLENFDPFHIQQTELMKLKKNVKDESETEEDKIQKNCLRLKVADRLKRVFELNDDDFFYGNYNVWLVKDVLLQGHIYLTKESILFFTFLPKRYSALQATSNTQEGFEDHDDSHDVIQSGSLGMKTAHYGDTVFSTPLTHRFWAILRNETITVYNSPSDLYFPITLIDLKTCVSAEILDKGKNESSMSPRPPLTRNDSQDVSSGDEEPDFSNVLDSKLAEENFENVSGGVWFKVVTKKKTHKFHSDSLYSARQWVNNIVKVVFQLHNSNANNEVLMKIPINHVINYEIQELFGENNNQEDEANPKILCINHIDDSKGKHSLMASRMKRELKKKTKRRGSKLSGHENDELFSEETHFLLFKDGDKVFNILDNIASQAALQKSKPQDTKGNIFKKHMSDSGSINKGKNDEYHEPRTISTLTPDHFQDSIVDQMAGVNNNKNNYPQSQDITSPKSEICSNSSIFTLPHSKMKRIGKTLSAPSRIFAHRGRSNSSSEKTTPERSGTTSPTGINFPKQLTLSGLKDLNMAFEASEKHVKMEDTRYSDKNYDDTVNDPNAVDQVNTQSKAEVLSPRPIAASALNLADPSEYEDNKKKHNKFSSIGKSIKAMSSMASKFGAPSHYESNGAEDPYFVNDVSTRDVATRHFQERFSFNSKKCLIATYHCHLIRAVPVFGKVYIGDSEICFRSLLPGVSTKMILPLLDVDACYKEKGTNIGYSGLVIIVRGFEELFMEFSVQKARDDCVATIVRQLDKNRDIENRALIDNDNEKVGVTEHSEYSQQNIDQRKSALSIKLAQARIENARLKLFEDKINAAAGLHIPIILEDSPFFKTETRPSTSFNFTLLTIGSRGDVQPYIALAKGLLAEGHNVSIATHSEFEEWIVGHGIQFKEIAGNPVELMSLMVTHGSMSLAFFKEANSKFRGWILDLLSSSWKACQGSDILIESPSAMVGAHIAEALGIPYMRAFTMPWTRTRAYPHAFIVPDKKKGGSYNYLTHLMFETVFWKGINGQVNKWRVEQLGIPKTNLYKLAQYDIPFLYNVSPTIFPPSVDFPDWVKVTGYWFLDEGAAADFTPSKELVHFMNKARDENKKIVYIGFGSIVVNDAKSLTKAVVDAVLEADVRCILNKGWSDKNSKPEQNDKEPEIELPEEIYNSGSIPHDWLFPKIDVAVHHGGSGTTGATMRAGIPTIIKPFFGDQFFYASRVEDIGAGLGIKKLNTSSLCRALKTATSDLKMIEKAKKVSERLKQETGVLNAIEAIYYELEYARSLILSKQHDNAKRSLRSGVQTPIINESSEEDYDDEAGYGTDINSDNDSLQHSEHGESYDFENEDDATVRVNDDSVNDVLTNVNSENLTIHAA